MQDKQFNGAAEQLRSPARLTLMEIARVVELSLENISAHTVLDVGTGTAVFAEAFARMGLDVSGVDSNPQLLDIARSYLPHADFQVACADELPFKDKEFDLVFLGHVLHETPDPLSALKDARRVARLRVAILEWPYYSEEQGPPLAHRLSPSILSKLARQAGFPGIEHINLEHMDFYRLVAV
ncbi:MAG: hypothetical protein BGO78_12950 [Chloroflexi bacterium 44-23]|nr:MAG: hypothetical protein BGO78_12950 [Chloroflexi bacterium 44-23]